jgi:hypothetical protein
MLTILMTDLRDLSIEYGSCGWGVAIGILALRPVLLEASIRSRARSYIQSLGGKEESAVHTRTRERCSHLSPGSYP